MLMHLANCYYYDHRKNEKIQLKNVRFQNKNIAAEHSGLPAELFKSNGQYEAHRLNN